jgi:hypothetical protein
MRFAKLVLAACLVALLVACGSSSPNVTPVAPSISITTSINSPPISFRLPPLSQTSNATIAMSGEVSRSSQGYAWLGVAPMSDVPHPLYFATWNRNGEVSVAGWFPSSAGVGLHPVGAVVARYGDTTWTPPTGGNGTLTITASEGPVYPPDGGGYFIVHGYLDTTLDSGEGPGGLLTVHVDF